MKLVHNIVRILLGLVLIFFGINGYAQFWPIPEMNELATTVLSGLFASKYVFAILPAIFLLSGLSFVFNRYVALFALLLAPFTLNILLFHLFLEPNGVIVAIVLVLMHSCVAWSVRKKYAPLFETK